MVSIDDAVLARYAHAGKHFEIYVDPVKALEFRGGKDVPLSEVLAVDAVFKDAKKGDRAAEGSLKETFQTSDLGEITKQILKKGEMQLTTEQKKKMVSDKKKAIIAKIVREAYNPQTKAPHTPQRIEIAMDEAHVQIDPFESTTIQVERAVNAIRSILPISMERLKIEVTVPPAYTGKAYGVLKAHHMEKEEWLPDGNLKAVVTIPAGLEEEFYDELNNISKGGIEFSRIKQ
ncbi:MAG: ribosome assembly factor SBDS [archaeon]